MGIGRNRLYVDLVDFQEKDLQASIDYGKVYSALNQERRKSMDFLKRSLQLTPVHKRYCTNPDGDTILYLFDILPLLKIKRRRNKTKALLFGLIPLLKNKT